jgi:hypothetical protein
MKANGRTLALVIPFTMLLGIVAGSVAGWWQTESSKDPIRFTEGEFAGEANPADIRGSYSLSDVSAAFDIPVDVLAQAFMLGDEANRDGILVKEFEERFGILPTADGTTREIGTDAMRLFVARYRGLPYEPEEDTGSFEAGVELVIAAAAIDDELLQDLQARVVTVPAPGDEAAVAPESEAESESEELLVKGNTTFGQLVQWGVSEDAIQGVVGMEIGAPGVTVRTWTVENGLEFEAIKESLQELVDLAVQ